ncbi:MAG: hypothetical protein JWQ14_3625 [Adhaeribacter sp.]|nr:hypothetical protein [Adhaeribacter sp.]
MQISINHADIQQTTYLKLFTMKKIGLLLIAMFSLSLAQAQVKLGIKGGINYSNIAGDLQEENHYENKIGFLGGVTANFPLVGDGFLSLQPELLYSQKGYQYQDDKVTIDNATYSIKGKRNFNYLDLPVLLRVNAGGLFFEGGPQASYLLGIRDNTEIENEGTGNDTKNWKKIEKDNLAELEIGYVAGVGYQAANGLGIGLRYNGSINHLAKSDPNNDELVNARHSAFQLQLGYTLGGSR